MPKIDELVLTDDQIQLIEWIAEGKPCKEMAEIWGCHINTITARKKHPAVVAALRDARRAGVNRAQAVFMNKAAWAAQKIVDMVDDPEATRVQFQAACKVYDSSVGTSVEDMEERIIALEEQITREV